MLNRLMRPKDALYGLLLAVVALYGLHTPVLARELTAGEKEVVSDAIKDRLRDPTSAMFKWGPIKGETKPTDGNEATTTYCGYVNSRNAFGGYVGDTPFRVDRKSVV